MFHVKPTAETLSTPPVAAIEIFGDALASIERYGQLLATTGLERGLLGPREVDRLWERHLLNCAALERWLPDQGQVVDLGSGAGLPGVVVALLRPDLDVVLLEPMLRRATFLSEVVAELAMPRVSVVRARAEEWANESPAAADVVVARAVAPLSRLVGWAAPLLAPDGVLLALKGRAASQELSAAGATLDRLGIVERGVHPVAVGASVTNVVRLQRGQQTAATVRSKRRSG
jgi:16S rRNA (guanine527-N7)-methyltransferase